MSVEIENDPVLGPNPTLSEQSCLFLSMVGFNSGENPLNNMILSKLIYSWKPRNGKLKI